MSYLWHCTLRSKVWYQQIAPRCKGFWLAMELSLLRRQKLCSTIQTPGNPEYLLRQLDLGTCLPWMFPLRRPWRITTWRTNGLGRLQPRWLQQSLIETISLHGNLSYSCLVFFFNGCCCCCMQQHQSQSHQLSNNNSGSRSRYNQFYEKKQHITSAWHRSHRNKTKK